MNYFEKYNEWISNPIFDKETKEELEKIKNDNKEIEDRFYKDLEFGTAGLRGVIGSGTNRMNKYTVGKATQGLANFILKEKGQDKGVVIGYDSRIKSKEFAEITALCLNANGIKTFLFEDLRPVPEVSYAVRELKCIAGVMITASHNPAKYNGYKVYWEDGAQITAPKDEMIIKEVNNIMNFEEIQLITKKQAIEKGLFNIIGKELDEKYFYEIKKQLLNKDLIKKHKDMSIVYTPLHGTGKMPVQKILNDIGFQNINIVKEQSEPDGNFTTCEYPNPENKDTFNLALKLAKEKKAELVLATDPDADRLGVYSIDSKTGEYKAFTGNMSALLILEYLLSQRKLNNSLSSKSVVIKSIVSSIMAKPITKEYGVELIEVLTGFKYIGEKIKEFEESKQYIYEFGYEESYGCLIGTNARDKDAIVAVMLLCEAAAFYKEQGLTLWDQMNILYEKYGFYMEDTIQFSFEGIEGSKRIKDIMDDLRNNPPLKFGNYNVERIRDYSNQTIIDLKEDNKEKINLPKSNVIYFELNNDSWICVRPSGTEPKIKYYIGIKGNSYDDAQQKMNYLKNEIINR